MASDFDFRQRIMLVHATRMINPASEQASAVTATADPASDEVVRSSADENAPGAAEEEHISDDAGDSGDGEAHDKDSGPQRQMSDEQLRELAALITSGAIINKELKQEL